MTVAAVQQAMSDERYSPGKELAANMAAASLRALGVESKEAVKLGRGAAQNILAPPAKKDKR
jgi:hypothetical protein